jgi:hypothetical protein
VGEGQRVGWEEWIERDGGVGERKSERESERDGDGERGRENAKQSKLVRVFNMLSPKGLQILTFKWFKNK